MLINIESEDNQKLKNFQIPRSKTFLTIKILSTSIIEPKMQKASTNLITKYKVVFIGDESVGKTSIINSICFDSFNENYRVWSLLQIKIVSLHHFIFTFFFYLQPTVGMDFITKIIHLENKALHLQLWDTSGREQFRRLIKDYLKDSRAVIIVYDITSMIIWYFLMQILAISFYD